MSEDPVKLDELSQLFAYYNEQVSGPRNLGLILKNDATLLTFANALCARIGGEMDLGHKEKVAMGLTQVLILGIFLGEIGKTQFLKEDKAVH
jgi:hypothetical protein